MGKIKSLEELKVWQEARVMNRMIFDYLYNNNELRDYDLKNQINRASGSVMDNIAEGFGRGGNREFRQFLTISRGSLSETKSQVLRSLDREYLNKEQSDELIEQIEKISNMIGGLTAYLNKTELKGSKYKVEEGHEIYCSLH